MTIIAMSHEIGTRGGEIAAKLAQDLGIELADEAMLSERIADRAAADLGSSWRSRAAEGDPGPRFAIDGLALAKFAALEIGELVAKGNVLIRGWGATSLLRHSPDVVCIRVLAPRSDRLRVLASRYSHEDQPSLLRLIERSDACLASNLQPLLGPDWRNAGFYHLTIDTHLLSVETAVALIGRFVADWRQTRGRAPCGLQVCGSPSRPSARRAAGGPILQDFIDTASLATAEQVLYGRRGGRKDRGW